MLCRESSPWIINSRNLDFSLVGFEVLFGLSNTYGSSLLVVQSLIACVNIDGIILKVFHVKTKQ